MVIDVRGRLADALRESLAPWMTGFCDGIEANINADSLLISVDELSDEIAAELLSLSDVAIVEQPITEHMLAAAEHALDNAITGCASLTSCVHAVLAALLKAQENDDRA